MRFSTNEACVQLKKFKIHKTVVSTNTIYIYIYILHFIKSVKSVWTSHQLNKILNYVKVNTIYKIKIAQKTAEKNLVDLIMIN